MSVIVSLPLKLQIWSFHQQLFSLIAPDLMVSLMVAESSMDKNTGNSPTVCHHSFFTESK